jgi:hypothetical protein
MYYILGVQALENGVQFMYQYWTCRPGASELGGMGSSGAARNLKPGRGLGRDQDEANCDAIELAARVKDTSRKLGG